jgi:hypothetical protein
MKKKHQKTSKFQMDFSWISASKSSYTYLGYAEIAFGSAVSTAGFCIFRIRTVMD